MLVVLAISLFTSAFLLFCLQPMVGKMVMPLLGGTASVWTTCVVFFQLMLLVGYAYAHVLGKLAKLRDQILVHLGLVFLAMAFLPIQLASSSGNPSAGPVKWILWNLLLKVGVPFAVVSTTAPLVQSWLSKTRQLAGRDPYFLYAISNAGSLLSLAAYPILLEPRYGVGTQSNLWFAGYVLLALLLSLSAWLVWTDSHLVKPSSPPASRFKTNPPTWQTRVHWLIASFVPSALMIAATTHITQDIGSFPFLWVLPLFLYLVTFVIAFARWFRVPGTLASAAATVALIVLFPIATASAPVPSNWVWLVLGCHMTLLFFGALLCHTVLAERRPAAAHLTEFYFFVAAGGVLGGMAAGIVAPLVFSTVFEYPLLVAALALFRSPGEPHQRFSRTDAAGAGMFVMFVAVVYMIVIRSNMDLTRLDDNAVLAVALVLAASPLLFHKRVLAFAVAFAILVIGYALVLPAKFEDGTRVVVLRNFFGVKKVLFEPDINMRKLLHGDTLHGRESLDAALAGEPLSYYHRTGPMGDVMALIGGGPGQRVGVVGLGTGSAAAYGSASRHITFFDVDPQVADIARRFFTYLERCGSACDVRIADGRLALQDRPDGEFDLLVLDAFSSDSIPSHLLSREAVRMYMAKLKPDGILMFHVSNRYLDVERLVASVLGAEGVPGFTRYDTDGGPPGKAASQYVIALRHPDVLAAIPNRGEWEPVLDPAGLRPWTDDYSNMMSIVKPRLWALR